MARIHTMAPDPQQADDRRKEVVPNAGQVPANPVTNRLSMRVVVTVLLSVTDAVVYDRVVVGTHAQTAAGNVGPLGGTNYTDRNVTLIVVV